MLGVPIGTLILTLGRLPVMTVLFELARAVTGFFGLLGKTGLRRLLGLGMSLDLIRLADALDGEVLAGLFTDHPGQLLMGETGEEHLIVDVESIGVLRGECHALGLVWGLVEVERDGNEGDILRGGEFMVFGHEALPELVERGLVPFSLTVRTASMLMAQGFGKS